MKRWPTRPLGEVAEVFNGKTPSKAEHRTFGHPVLKIKDVDQDGNFRGRHESFVDPTFAEVNASKKVCTSDVLILNAAHNAEYVASKIFFAGAEVRGTIATGEWTIIRANSSSLSPGFVYHWVRSQVGRTSLKNLVRGIHLYPSDVASIQFPVPRLAEQERIVNLLDEADKLRKLRAQADSRSAALIPALFHEMFGEVLTNEKGWNTSELQHVSANITDGKHGDCRPSPDSGYYFVSVKDIVNGRIDYSNAREILYEDFIEVHKRTRLENGDVLITNSGTIGRTAVVTDDMKVARTTFQKSVAIIKPLKDRVHPVYLKAALDRCISQFVSASSGSAQKNLLLSQLRRFSICLPPLSLQTEFAQSVAEIGELEAAQAASRLRLDDLFQSLLHRAFNGEL